MVAAVAVENVYLVYFVKLVLLGVGAKNSSDSGVETAAEKRRYACVPELLVVGPLPFVFKFSSVFGLVVGGVHVVGLGCKACVHYRKVLIWEGEIHDDVWLLFFYEPYQFIDIVSVYAGGGNFRLGCRGEFFSERVAF